MIHTYVNRVLEHSVTTGAARLLMLVIAARADENGICQLSHRELSRLTKMDVRSLRRLLFAEDSPIPADELEVFPGGNFPGQHRQTTKYKITL